MRQMVFICNNCGNHEEQPDCQDFDNLDEIVYITDVGCSLCRQKDVGYTPYIQLTVQNLNEQLLKNNITCK